MTSWRFSRLVPPMQRRALNGSLIVLWLESIPFLVGVWNLAGQVRF